MTPWRLIDTGPLDGPANMAVDEALLACFDPQRSAPVLRLYGWYPPAMSVGRFQKAAEVLDLGKCAVAGVPVVRRITGGGAIYHAKELTYAIVCAPHHIPAATSIQHSFRLLTRFLLRFYQLLGLQARYAVEHFPAGTRLGQRTPFCYAGKENYDIVINGRKMGGNAQRRLKQVIFQHGSIPVENCAAYGATFLQHPPLGMAERTGSLHDFGIMHAECDLARLLASAFGESFPAHLSEESLTAEESSFTTRLLEKTV